MTKSAAFGDPQNVTYLMKGATGSFDIPVTGSRYVKLNAGQYGFYRVLYDEIEWNKMVDALDKLSLDPIDRAGLLDDAFNLARSGKMPYERAMAIIEYMAKEEEFVPWNVASSAINFITDNYEGEFAGKWRKIIAEKAGTVLTKIGFKGKPSDSFTVKRLRPILISLACRHGNAKCLKNAKTAFDAWLQDQNTNAVDVNVRQQIYQYGMKSAGETEWNKVHEIYKKTNVPQESKKLRAAMSMPMSPWLLRRYIDYAKDEKEGFKGQDYFTIMEYIANNPVGLPEVWNYIKSHWTELVDRFGISDRYFGRMVGRIISHFNTDFQLQDVNRFFEEYPDAGAGKRARKEGLTNIKDNIAWKKANEDSLTKWLETQ